MLDRAGKGGENVLVLVNVVSESPSKVGGGFDFFVMQLIVNSSFWNI
jgi:hypothetical protein